MVRECQATSNASSALENSVAEVITIQAEFEEFKIQYVYREQNVATHNLAKHAWQVDRIVMWGNPPEFLDQAILAGLSMKASN